MRTTADLPEDVHRAVARLARDCHQSLSRTVADLVRTGHSRRAASALVEVDPDTGFGLYRVGRPVTAADVAAVGE